MKTVKVLFLILIVTLFASTAMAANVTINGQSQISCSGTLLLSNMQVDSAGNVSITVTCTGGTCTPSSSSVSPLSIVRSITQGSTAASQIVSITDNCGTALGYSAAVTSGGSFISVPSSGTGSMTVTFNTAGLAASTYSGTIQVTPAGYAPQNISVTVTVSTGGGSAINMTTSGRLPSYLNNQTVSGNGSANYYAVTDNNYAKVTVYLESLDWDATDMDLIISNVRQPQCSEIVRGTWSAGTNGVWFNSLVGRSNETVFIRSAIPAGTTIYATVCNFTPSITGKFRISWSASQ